MSIPQIFKDFSAGVSGHWRGFIIALTTAGFFSYAAFKEFSGCRAALQQEKLDRQADVRRYEDEKKVLLRKLTDALKKRLP